MANRSYLYSVDTVPELDNPPIPIRGISEHNWSIPLMHELLAGRGPRVCESVIWDHPVAIVADFAGGVDLATRFLRVLADGDTPEHAAVAERAASITEFLNADRQAGTYFLLEPGEILQLEGGDVAEIVDRARGLAEGDIPFSVRRAERAIAGEEPAWLAEILADWRTHIDSFYSHVLYFSFK